jgi:alpha-ketoglutarate-dependent taurine dioxygenase
MKTFSPGAVRRRTVQVSEEELVKTGYLHPSQAIPLVIQPAVVGLNATAWIGSHREFIDTKLLEHRAILFRDFGLESAEDFEQFISMISEELLEYRDRSSPRHQVHDKIYTSTDYPNDQSIFLHNENSYQNVWPLKIYFYCQTAAEQGGETPIADVRRVYERISAPTRQRFIERQVLYQRNFNHGFGLTWQTVFQTSDPQVVEQYCRRNAIEFEWRGEGRLRTRQVRPAVAQHPGTGEWVWFNHAAFFHVTTLEETLRDVLLAEFAVEDLPFNTYYGDGGEIESDVLEELRAAYQAEKVSFGWQRGDVLLLDNMSVAHGREPYEGERKVLVGMAEPCNRREISHG